VPAGSSGGEQSAIGTDGETISGSWKENCFPFSRSQRAAKEEDVYIIYVVSYLVMINRSANGNEEVVEMVVLSMVLSHLKIRVKEL
jgi:hypothetical protein